MSVIFFVSYVILWVLVIILTVACVHLLKRKPATLAPDAQLYGSEDGMPLGTPFPYDGRLTLDGEVPHLQNALVIFSMTNCGSCGMIYPHLHQFQQEHPQIPIYIMLFEVQEGEVRQNVEKYQLELPVIPCVRQDTEFFQTNSFPFGYALNQEGLIASKGHLNDENHLNLLASSIIEKKGRLTKAG